MRNMKPFLWLTQLFHTFLRFIMPPQRNDEMRVFSTDKDVTNASNLLSSLKENLPFLDHGLGNIIVTQVEYCKCRFGAGSRWEHEFLIVTLEESVRARRTALLMVDRLNDDTKEYKGPGELLADLVRHQSQEMVDVEADVEANVEVTADSTDSNSSASSSIESSTTASPARALPNAQQWGTTNRFHRSGAKVKRITKGDPPNALDRLIVLPNRGAIARELGGCLYDVLMTMDLTQSQIDRPVALENFGHLLRTTSRNTPQYHFIFAQCYWYAYTIWKVLELETQPHIHKGALAGRQCSHSLTGYGQRLILGRGRSVNEVRTPETIKAEWDAEKVAEEEEWAQLKQQYHAPLVAAEEARHQAEAARQDEAEARRQAEEARQDEAEARRQAEARVRELERRLEGLEHPPRSADAV